MNTDDMIKEIRRLIGQQLKKDNLPNHEINRQLDTYENHFINLPYAELKGLYEHVRKEYVNEKMAREITRVR